MEPLAAVTLPILEWRCEWIGFSYVDTDRSQPGAPATRADVTDLPVSFRALWLHTTSICVPVAEHSGGAVLHAAAEADDINGAEEFCRVLSLAPACYEEFRLYADVTHPMVDIASMWMLADGNKVDNVDDRFQDLQALAAAMHRFASAHGLAVSLSADDTFLRIDWVGPRQVSA